MNILIIKMWAIGDIVMATPMLNAIRAAQPDARISWLVDAEYADILAGHPQIDELIALDSGSWRRLRRQGRLIAWIRHTSRLRAQMKERQFDIVINCQAQDWWSLFLCAAPKRVGLFPWPHKAFLRRFYTLAITKPRLSGLHNTDHFLQATSALGFRVASKKMSIGETAGEQAFVDEFLRAQGLEEGRLSVVLAPFSTAANRSLDPTQAAQIADWLASQYQAQIIMTCGPKESARAREIASRAKQAKVAIAENATLRDYIAILRRAELVITGDSSPMHLAAALGTPYVALFGPTPADERAPLAGDGTVIIGRAPCAPCDLPTCANKVFQQCMKAIELSDVQKAASQILERQKKKETITGDRE